MPNIRIPLITGRPGPSAPTLTAESFGAARARGLGSLAQGIETGGQAVVRGFSEIERVDQQIEDAKQDQILWEKTAQGQASIDEARFNAEDAVPSEASLNGQAQTKIKDPKTLQQEYESFSDQSISKLGEGLSGLRLEQFESRMRIAKQDGLIQIRQVQRARDIDEGRAAFARQEEILHSRAADPNADIEQIIAEKKAAGDAAKEGGLWGAEQTELNFQAFERDARKTHETAQFNAQVNASVDGFMSINASKFERVGVARKVIPPGPLQDAVVKDIKLQSDEEQGRIIQSEKDAADRSFKLIRQGAGSEAIERGVTEPDHRTMDKYIAARAKEAARGAVFTIPTKAEVYDEILNEYLNDPEKFKGRDLFKSRMDLADKEFNFWDKVQGNMAADLTGGKEGQAIFGISEITNTMMDQSGIDNDDTRAELRLQIIQDAQIEQEKKGSPLTFREEELIVSRRVGSVDFPDWVPFHDTQKRIQDLTAADRQTILDDPPEQFIREAVEGLKRQGNDNPTVEQVDAAIDSWLTQKGVPRAE